VTTKVPTLNTKIDGGARLAAFVKALASLPPEQLDLLNEIIEREINAAAEQ
jgi:hypothetical protein